MPDQLTMHAALGTEGHELLSIDGDRKANRCTASCLDARAELRAAILGTLAEGHGSRRAAQAFGVSREVVRALKKQAIESGELDQVKQSIGLGCYALADATRDRIEDELDDMPRASLPIVLGVLIDKAQLLTGGATARVVTHQAPLDINELVDSLPRVHEVGAERVDSGEKAPAKGELLADLDPLEIGSGELESPVSTPRSEGEPANGTGNGQIPPKKDAA